MSVTVSSPLPRDAIRERLHERRERSDCRVTSSDLAADVIEDDERQKLCPDCRDLQQHVVGTLRIGKRLFCEVHFGKRLGQRPRVKLPAETLNKLYPPDPVKPKRETKEERMPKGKRLTAGEWSSVQHDRNAGVSVPELEEKYGVSQPTIYAHTRPAGEKRAPEQTKLPRRLQGGNALGREVHLHVFGAGKGKHDKTKITFVDLDDVPGRIVPVDQEYAEIWQAVKLCPKGKAVCAPVPHRLRGDKDPANCVRGAVGRMAAREKIKLKVSCAHANGMIYIVARKK